MCSKFTKQLYVQCTCGPVHVFTHLQVPSNGLVDMNCHVSGKGQQSNSVSELTLPEGELGTGKYNRVLTLSKLPYPDRFPRESRLDPMTMVELVLSFSVIRKND